MKNEYRTRWFRCGEFVEAWESECTKVGSEHIAMWPAFQSRIVRPAWLVEHPACAEKYHGTNVHFHYNPVQPSDLPA